MSIGLSFYNNRLPCEIFMLIIGERINSTRKSIFRAIESNDAALIQNDAKIQTDAGADYIDVNAGAFPDAEEERLKWLIAIVQGATALPLCLDSSNPQVISKVMPLVNQPPMINSISLTPAPLAILLPLIKQTGAKVIALCQAEGRLAQSVDDKIRIAQSLVEKVSAAGIPLDNLYIDPLIFPLANDVTSAGASLTAITKIMAMHPGVHTTCGLTNVSFGLPSRKLINRTFLVTAIAHGLDSAILDPTDPQLYGALKTAVMVMGKDRYCMNYLAAFKQGRLE
jgi:5-methyltetrahydrofolate--homocysteine methyltransferase